MHQIRCKCSAIFTLIAFLQHNCEQTPCGTYYQCVGRCHFPSYNLKVFKRHVQEHLAEDEMATSSSEVPLDNTAATGDEQFDFYDSLDQWDPQYPESILPPEDQFPSGNVKETGEIMNIEEMMFDEGTLLPPLPPDENYNKSDIRTPFFEDPFDHDHLVVDGKRFDDYVKEKLLLMTATFYGRTELSGKSVQMIVEEITAFYKTVVMEFMHKKIMENYRELKASEKMVSELDFLFFSVNDVLGSISTRSRRFNLFKEAGTLIMPEPQVLGSMPDVKRTETIPRNRQITCYAQFIPIREVLKNFFEIPGVYRRTMEYVDFLKNSDIDQVGVSNYMQGEYWKSQAEVHGDKPVLPSAVYCDDYETNNVQGSHAGGQGKQGGFYFNILCLPPELQSQLNCIFEFLSFNSLHRKIFGNEAVFRRVVEELNFLITEGITVETEDGPKKLYFSLQIIEGDNLGLNSLMGFTECFGHGVHFCRFCTVTSSTNTMSREDPKLLRTMDSYEENVKNIQPGKLKNSEGVKENSVWNLVLFFHILLNYSVDLMHDLLEGICKMVLAEVLYYYTYVTKDLDENTLNDRIAGFAFGRNEGSNIPPDISPEHIKAKNIRLSSAEVLCLFTTLGMLIGDKIPTRGIHCEFWKLYTTLVPILNVLLRRTIHKLTFEYLADLIEIHIELYKKLISSQLTPKYHFLTHYPRIMKLIGPLVNIWSMRNKSKNREKKMAARSYISRVNTSKSGSIKSQLRLNYILQSGIVPESQPQLLEEETINLLTDCNFSYARSAIPPRFNPIVKAVREIRHMGLIFKKNVIIVIFAGSKPEFFEIKDIIRGADNIIYFISNHIESSFNSHYQAYEVSEPADNLDLIPFDSVSDVTFKTRLPNGSDFICNKW